MKNLEWLGTDEYQFMRVREDIGAHEYEFVEFLSLNDEVFGINHAIIGYEDYSESDILEYIEAYGYNSIKDVEELYGESYKAIIAECIFESSEDSEFVRTLVLSECIELMKENFQIAINYDVTC